MSYSGSADEDENDNNELDMESNAFGVGDEVFAAFCERAQRAIDGTATRTLITHETFSLRL